MLSKAPNARKRSVSSALMGIDKLLQMRPIYGDPDTDAFPCEGHVRCPATESCEGASLSLSPQKRSRGDINDDPLSSSSPLRSTDIWDESPNSPSNLGGTLLELLHRKDEERADMALFLAKTLARLPTVANLCELIELFAVEGVDAALSALKHAGSLEAFFDSLWPVRFAGLRGSSDSDAEQAEAALLQFMLVLVRQTELDLFCRRPVVAALVSRLGTARSKGSASADGAADTPAATANPSPAPRHWSERRRTKKTTSSGLSPSPASPTSSSLERREVPPADPPGSRLTRAVASIVAAAPLGDHSSRADTNIGVAGLTLAILLDLVLRQNQRTGEFIEGTCVPREFAAQGGFLHLARALSASSSSDVASGPSAFARMALSFLEVVTVSNRLGEVPSIGGAAATLVDSLSARDSLTRQLDRLSVLRVLTNITGISPAILDPSTRAKLGAALRRMLDAHLSGSDGILADEAVFSLCCAVNVLKWERREGHLECTAAILRDEEKNMPATAESSSTGCLHAVAAAMLGCYQGDQTADVVRSGYYALFMGVSSLAQCPVRDDGSYRVPVITAIAAAARRADVGVSSIGKPMAIVVAILQEFLIFQSQSGTLTRDALAEMHAILAALVRENNIEFVTQ